MKALDRDIRRQLERTVRRARMVAEEGALRKLTELGVLDGRAPSHLSDEERSLRVRLRAHARALGDMQKADDTIVGPHLVREIAYEQWHRALFARFLAENGILVDPDHRVPVSLEDLTEIAREQNDDPFELAAKWAAPMLPAIFRADDPALAMRLPPESRSELRELVAGLPPAVFAADDSLGWAYQFWQADEKERVNNSAQAGAKIGADELPAVTQLFTEDYMVLFILENTLGAWWAAKKLRENPNLADTAHDEQALRTATSPPGWHWQFLRFTRVDSQEGSATWQPAAGAFEGWPRSARELTVLDPCMGSGHFLVFALPILVAMRCAEESLSETDGVLAVLRDNIFGLELDPRCTQIAAFALALAAWKRLGGWRELPAINVACSGLAIGMTKTEWLRLAERLTTRWSGDSHPHGAQSPPLREADTTRHREGLSRLYDLFRDAPTLGSLIHPEHVGEDIFASEAHSSLTLLADVLSSEAVTPEVHEAAVVAQGLSLALKQLGRTFTLIATNVPFLGRNKQDDVLASYADRWYRPYRSDLYAMFMARCERFTADGGTFAFVSPQAWTFQTSFRPARKQLFEQSRVSALADLGRGAFSDMNWWAATTALTILTKDLTREHYTAVDATTDKNPAVKAANVRTCETRRVPASSYLGSAEHSVLIEPIESATTMADCADVLQGVGTTDLPRFTLSFWEVDRQTSAWVPYQLAPTTDAGFSGCTDFLRWENGEGPLAQIQTAHKGLKAAGKRGIGIAVNNSLRVTHFLGTRFDCTLAVLVPKPHANLRSIADYAFSPTFKTDVRRVDQALSVTEASFLKVPFDPREWEVAEDDLPVPHSSDPTQWLFDGRPLQSDRSICLRPIQVAVARMLGYRWPRQTGSSFMDCPAINTPDLIDQSVNIDADGIVCLAPLYGESAAAERLRNVLAAAFGEKLDIPSLLRAESSSAHDLETWLREEFAEAHSKLFYQRPFIWQIWDGLSDGFVALVNYHSLCRSNGEGRRLLEKLRDTYLGEWIAVQQRRVDADEAGAEARLVAARHLSDQLSKIIEGEPPFDIFVRWKPLSAQPAGWEPDVNDGVRVNIRPFMSAATKNGRSILRYRPAGIKWNKDRGAEPQRPRDEFPWFWAEKDDALVTDFAGGAEFRGIRFNDFHYTRAAKEAARRKAQAA